MIANINIETQAQFDAIVGVVGLVNALEGNERGNPFLQPYRDEVFAHYFEQEAVLALLSTDIVFTNAQLVKVFNICNNEGRHYAVFFAEYFTRMKIAPFGDFIEWFEDEGTREYIYDTTNKQVVEHIYGVVLCRLNDREFVGVIDARNSFYTYFINFISSFANPLKTNQNLNLWGMARVYEFQTRELFERLSERAIEMFMQEQQAIENQLNQLVGVDLNILKNRIATPENKSDSQYILKSIVFPKKRENGFWESNQKISLMVRKIKGSSQKVIKIDFSIKEAMDTPEGTAARILKNY